MSSTAGTFAGWHRGSAFGVAHSLRFTLGVAALGLLLFLAIVFIARRLAGGFVQPLGGPALIAAAAGIAALAAATWAMRFGRTKPRIGTEYSVLSTQYLLLATATILSVALLASLTTADSAPWAVTIAWFTLIAGEAASWRIALRKPSDSFRRPIARKRTSPDEANESIPDNVLQQLTRVREVDGSESLHALAQAEIPAGDRLAVLHLAFCPPLDAPPELTAHALEADDAEVRITAAETYGTRLEVRITQPAAEPRRVLVEVLGRSSHVGALGRDLG